MRQWRGSDTKIDLVGCQATFSPWLSDAGLPMSFSEVWEDFYLRWSGLSCFLLLLPGDPDCFKWFSVIQCVAEERWERMWICLAWRERRDRTNPPDDGSSHDFAVILFSRDGESMIFLEFVNWSLCQSVFFVDSCRTICRRWWAVLSWWLWYRVECCPWKQIESFNSENRSLWLLSKVVQLTLRSHILFPWVNSSVPLPSQSSSSSGSTSALPYKGCIKPSCLDKFIYWHIVLVL